MTDKQAEFEGYGFRWASPTPVRLPDGRTATIVPDFYRISLEANATEERGRKYLRFYKVQFADGSELALKHELDVERLIGEDPDAIDEASGPA